jgi:hypothetical protein
MTPEAEPADGDEGRLSRAPGMQFSEMVMPAGRRTLVEGEKPVVSFLQAEGETEFGIEAILEHPGPDCIRAHGWTNAAVMRGSHVSGSGQFSWLRRARRGACACRRAPWLGPGR